MVLTQYRSKRKITGGRYKFYRKKRLYEKGNLPSLTKIGKRDLKIIRTRGGSLKQRLFNVDVANLLDKKTNTYSKVKIISVTDNPANRHFIRRNIITKGTIIETEKGKAKVTSRPGQDGTVNAVLIS